jgi:hypothetical protein
LEKDGKKCVLGFGFDIYQCRNFIKCSEKLIVTPFIGFGKHPTSKRNYYKCRLDIVEIQD